jgi:ATP phosphoribosyltransferase
MIRIAIQAKGRLNESSLALLNNVGMDIDDTKRKYLAKSQAFPLEVLYLRDDDIPETVFSGAADIGIVGYNEVVERGFDLKVEQKLAFGQCRLSLAIPKSEQYPGPQYFEGKRIATSYPRILKRYLEENKINAEIHEIAGSVEIAPSIGVSDAIFDIVSSGGTLVQNALKEVEVVLESQTVLVSSPCVDPEKRALLEQLKFRFQSIIDAKGKKYLLMNIPTSSVEDAIRIIPAMRSPTVMPLALEGWSSLHSVVNEKDLWDKVEQLRKIGAEGILVLDLEKIII